MTAARILKGQMNGFSGEETQLEMDKFPHVALAKVSALTSCTVGWSPSDSGHNSQAAWEKPRTMAGRGIQDSIG